MVKGDVIQEEWRGTDFVEKKGGEWVGEVVKSKTSFMLVIF